MAENKTFVVEWFLPDSAPFHRTEDVSEQIQKLVQSLDKDHGFGESQS